jgi:uncharacterized protein YggE
MTRITRFATSSFLGIASLITALALAVSGCGSTSGRAAAAATTATTAVLTASTTGGATGPTITAVGHGKVTGTPDVMSISLGVQTTGGTAQAALDDNATRSQNLVALLKRNGVADADLQTTDLSVYPNFDAKGQHIVGYTVSNTVTAKLRKIASAGPLIDAAAFVVGDAIRLNGISFSIDDTSALVAQARADAVKQALAQGQQLASAAGVRLGKIQSIDETPDDTTQPVQMNGPFDAAAAKSIAVESGSQDVTLDVKVVFAIDE